MRPDSQDPETLHPKPLYLEHLDLITRSTSAHQVFTSQLFASYSDPQHRSGEDLDETHTPSARRGAAVSARRRFRTVLTGAAVGVAAMALMPQAASANSFGNPPGCCYFTD